MNQGFASRLEEVIKNNDFFQRYALQQFNRINEQEEERQTMVMYQSLVGEKNTNCNRYAKIVPYDKSRIVLEDRRMGENDYINASLIVAPYGIPRHYIATQGPLRNTVVDFWRAVLEYCVPVIVCLTTETENELEKCTRYWPLGDKTMRLQEGEVRVVLRNSEEEKVNRSAGCVIREIKVEVYRQQLLVEEAKVVQLQFLGWPDHGVPDKPDKLIGLIKLARGYRASGKPMLVHCSAGCGRTGAFCVIDSAECLVRMHACAMDPIAHLTEEFRKHRTTLVQTQSQFNFCYVTLLQLLKENNEK
ncbi:protein-tyrosine phosphatase-like protein [Sporodiniella umbellata]|nr:protein-tyrosine phosphatase-like protein [Sporodiniella umbellata]